MGGGFQYFDIILFAMIAVFLILRLRSALGRRDGHEGDYRDLFSGGQKDKPPHDETRDNIVQLPNNGTEKNGEYERDDIEESVLASEPEVFEGPAAYGLEEIRTIDERFSAKAFVQGARGAFEMILGAYASGDTKTLKSLLSPDVYENFESAIKEREAAGETLDETLVGIITAEVVEAGVSGDEAIITVKFVSEQISALRDKEGTVIDGDPAKVIRRVDFWTFSRDRRSDDPNWFLVETSSPH